MKWIVYVMGAIAVVIICLVLYLRTNVRNVQADKNLKISNLDIHNNKLEATPEFVDLGTIMQGEKLSCSFILTNRWSQEIKILAVKVSCDCTKTELSNKVLSPGESGILKVHYDSLRVSRRQTNIPLPIFIVTNSPSENVVCVKICVTVKTKENAPLNVDTINRDVSSLLVK